MKKLNKKGFTLTELIVVIAVIAILAAVLIPTLTGYIEKARVSADNQEVAVLNKLLLYAENNEIELENVPQLKKYLEEEMEYDGDYSLGVKGSYLFYDKEKYEFVIVKEDEVDGLKMMANDYALATTLTSPEGLLVDNDGNEVLLVGGNGDLVELVESIRNVGNTGQNIKIPENLNSTLKTAFEGLFTEYVFSGTSGQFTIDATTGEVTISTATDKNVVSANGSTSDYTIAELREKFHNDVIVANLTEINNSLGTKAELVIDDENPYHVNVVIKENGLFEIVGAVFDIVKILSENGCTSGYILPEEFEELNSYVEVLKVIKDTDQKQTESLKTFKKNFAKQVSDSGLNPELVETYYMVDLSIFNPDQQTTIEELLNLVYPIFVSLNLYENAEGNYDTKATELEYNMNLIKNKNTIRIIGNISDLYTVQYDFYFDTSALDAGNNA